MARPLVLLSNDDGFASPGLHAAKDALAAWADVVVVAPETEQSASSHALSLHRPLRARDVARDEKTAIFAVDGTPADCVYVALHVARILPRRPDVVVSGINRGLNLGQDVFYSGTVAAAREAAIRGIPALAASAHPAADMTKIAALVLALAKDLATRTTLPRAPLVNLNVPRAWTGDVKKTKLGLRVYDDLVDVRKDPRGREYMWIGGPGVHHDPDPGSDTDAYDARAASLTSLALDLTLADDAGVSEALAMATTQSPRA